MPLSGEHYIDRQGQIRDGMGQHTLGQAAGPVEKQIVDDSRNDAGQDIIVLETKQNAGEEERCPGKSANGDGVEILVDDVANQK